MSPARSIAFLVAAIVLVAFGLSVLLLRKNNNRGSSSLREMPTNQDASAEDETGDGTMLRGDTSDSDSTLSSKIYGGRAANPGEFPYFASAADQYICGGSLVSPYAILTAAHCTSAWTVGTTASIGGTGLFGKIDGEQRLVNQVIQHPDYTDFGNPDPSYFHGSQNDLMVVCLEEASTQPPVVLNFATPPVGGQRVTAVGHGKRGRSSAASTLQTVQLTVDDPCRLQRFFFFRYLLPWPTGEFCVGANDGRKDTCGGDSGSPILDTVTGEQIGLVSEGPECALSGLSGFYQNVIDYEDFITTAIATCDPSR